PVRGEAQPGEPVQCRAGQHRRLLQLQRQPDLPGNRERAVIGRRLVAYTGWVVCALGALACKNGGTNNNPPPPPAGTGGIIVIMGNAGMGGTTGSVSVEIQAPTADLVAPTGSLFDVRVVARVDQGSDFIDPTSVRAVVTATGDTAELESTTLAPQGGDVFSGRVSIGDHPSGAYTLTVTAASSGGLKGKAILGFQIESGPVLVVTSPRPLHCSQ